MHKPSASTHHHLLPREVLCFGPKPCCTAAGSPKPLAARTPPGQPGERGGRGAAGVTRPPTLVCAAQGRTRPPLLPGAALRDRPATRFQPERSQGPGAKRWTYTQIDGQRYTRIHMRHDRPWEVVASQCVAKRLFLRRGRQQRPTANSSVPRASLPPGLATRSSPRQAARGREQPPAPAPPSRTNPIRHGGNPKGAAVSLPPQPSSWRRGGERGPLFPFPGLSPPGGGVPAGPRQPGSPHGSGPGYCCPPWNRQLVGRVALRAGEAVPETAELPPRDRRPAAAAGPAEGNAAPTRESQRQPRRPQARSGSALPPLSPARSLPPLGGSAQTRRSMQRATAGQDKGVLAGSYQERRYCSIAKRPSPAARSLASFPPARLLPAPACSAAADSSRRPPPGRAGSASSLRDRSTALRPARPAPPPPGPRRGKPGPPACPPRATRGSRPPSPPLRPGAGGRGAPPRLAGRAEGLAPSPGCEGAAPPPAAALAGPVE